MNLGYLGDPPPADEPEPTFIDPDAMDVAIYIDRLIKFVVLSLVAILLAVLVLVAVAVKGAFAHSWYPAECCSSQDCEPIASDEVRIDGNDYVLPTGHRVPMSTARRSRDRDFHWCRTLSQPRRFIEPSGKPACFFAPQGDM
jgi:hypothetical protein